MPKPQAIFAGESQKTLPESRQRQPWWTFWILFIFFLLGGGEGGVRRQGGWGGRFPIENSRGGVSPRRGTGRGSRECPLGFRGGGGGGLNVFFSGPKCPPSNFRQPPDYSSNLCVRLRDLRYDFSGGVLGRFFRKTTGRRPKTPPKKSYSKCVRRTQIR